METPPRRRRRIWRRALAVLLLLVAAALAVLWSMRAKLAGDYIDRMLAERGVQASYEIRRIGFGSQILENLVIGDPRHPDATIRHAEIGILVGFRGPRIGLVKARGVRLYGRIVDGRVSLGQIDRLLPAPGGAPFRLPDQAIDVDDAAMVLETPAGRVVAGVTGRGNLAGGFRGSVALLAPALRFGDCALGDAHAALRVAVDALHPRVTGPVAVRDLRCPGLAVDRPLLALDATFAPTLDSWRGASAFRLTALVAPGIRAGRTEGRIGFDGGAGRMTGTLRVDGGPIALAATALGDVRIDGRYDIAPRRRAGTFAADVDVTDARLPPAALAGIAAPLRAAAATPLGPIAAGLADAIARAGRGAAAHAHLAFAGGAAGGTLRATEVRVDAASGARFAALGGDGIVWSWPEERLRLSGDFALSGGGFPAARLSLAQAGPGAPLEGHAEIAPMQAGGARLALSRIDFIGAVDGRTRFDTVARLDGPLAGGGVRGLVVPLSGSFGPGGARLGERCVAARFDALQVQSLRIGATRLPLCPIGRALVWQDAGGVHAGATIAAPRLAGRLGDSPVALAATRLRGDLSGFAAEGLALRLGPESGQSRLDIARLSGRFGGTTGGDFAGLSGDLAAVPLLVGEGQGHWQFSGGALNADGHVRIADRQAPVRFQPVVSDDVHFALAGNRIHVTGTLAHPGGGQRLANATVDHDLATGAGEAVLAVPGLVFAPGFQPDTLTPLTVGLVALVNGAIEGEGRIEWDASGVRSTGTFSTTGMNLAAPFGPVEGLTTSIRFTDLLGLASAPGQAAHVDAIHAGIDVFDGDIRYQLRPDYHVAVESAHWPFAGGDLTLRPTMLDFSRPSAKDLVFAVDGLDAARFIEQLDFSNIAATGTFDGVVPMRFGEDGAGQIAGGRLTARPAGGTLSYVGELSDRDLGAYGVLAFDALKSLRYDRLDLSLDGALDGEFITRVDLNGIAVNPAGTEAPSGGIPGLVVGRVLNQLARIPFRFHIRIEGRFRALMATARSFSDPTALIQSALPAQLQGQDATTTVQHDESEPKP